jgi:hypothetical protein
MASAGLVEDQIALRINGGMHHFLNALTASFSSDWFDDKHGNLLFEGTNGKGAQTVADAFAAWKDRGGKYFCTGLSNNFDKKKYAAFSTIVSAHRQRCTRTSLD